MKARIVSAIVFMLIGILCLATEVQQFNVPFLVIGALCIVFGIVTILNVKGKGPRLKQRKEEEFEL